MKMPKGQGYYTFADGYFAWYYGLSTSEKRGLIRQHGEVINYKPGM